MDKKGKGKFARKLIRVLSQTEASSTQTSNSLWRHIPHWKIDEFFDEESVQALSEIPIRKNIRKNIQKSVQKDVRKNVQNAKGKRKKNSDTKSKYSCIEDPNRSKQGGGGTASWYAYFDPYLMKEEDLKKLREIFNFDEILADLKKLRSDPNFGKTNQPLCPIKVQMAKERALERAANRAYAAKRRREKEKNKKFHLSPENEMFVEFWEAKPGRTMLMSYLRECQAKGTTLEFYLADDYFCVGPIVYFDNLQVIVQGVTDIYHIPLCRIVQIVPPSIPKERKPIYSIIQKPKPDLWEACPDSVDYERCVPEKPAQI